ncbi:MAG: hypothetical protein JWO36_6927 [Myxococcales bacterium]|nr:hypothetical protein [Myxococcales bacterium]
MEQPSQLLIPCLAPDHTALSADAKRRLSVPEIDLG